MSVPFRTFTQSTTLMQLLTSSKVSLADLGSYYNFSYREILTSYEWSTREKEGTITTIADYAVGTVTTTTGSAVITGIGTAFTASMVGEFIQVNNANTRYKITGFSGATSLTVEAPIAEPSATSVPYLIYASLYSLPSDCGELMWPTEQLYIEERDLKWLNLRDPLRITTTNVAQAYVPRGLDANGNMQIEFWPRYAAATLVRIPYYLRVDDLSGASQPIIRSDLIEYLALKYACLAALSKFGDQRWDGLADRYEKDYDRLIIEAQLEDMPRHNLPRSVKWARPPTRDWGFYVSHDVS